MSSAGSSAWIALVELIPVGTRDTVLPRRLVRVLVGPLKLPAGPGAKSAVAPLYGLRWPENAHADQLVATEAATAKEDKKKDSSTYTIDGTGSPAKTPLASPIFS